MLYFQISPKNANIQLSITNINKEILKLVQLTYANNFKPIFQQIIFFSLRVAFKINLHIYISVSMY